MLTPMRPVNRVRCGSPRARLTSVGDEESSVWLTVPGWGLGAEDLPTTTRLVFGNGAIGSSVSRSQVLEGAFPSVGAGAEVAAAFGFMLRLHPDGDDPDAFRIDLPGFGSGISPVVVSRRPDGHVTALQPRRAAVVLPQAVQHPESETLGQRCTPGRGHGARRPSAPRPAFLLTVRAARPSLRTLMRSRRWSCRRPTRGTTAGHPRSRGGRRADIAVTTGRAAQQSRTRRRWACRPQPCSLASGGYPVKRPIWASISAMFR
jgi:hypothetical protein